MAEVSKVHKWFSYIEQSSQWKQGKTKETLKINQPTLNTEKSHQELTLLNINSCISTQIQNNTSNLTNTNFRRADATKTVYTVSYSTTMVHDQQYSDCKHSFFTCLLLLQAERELGWGRMMLYCLWYSMTHSYISVHFHATTSHHTSRVLIFHQPTWSRLQGQPRQIYNTD